MPCKLDRINSRLWLHRQHLHQHVNEVFIGKPLLSPVVKAFLECLQQGLVAMTKYLELLLQYLAVVPACNTEQTVVSY